MGIGMWKILFVLLLALLPAGIIGERIYLHTVVWPDLRTSARTLIEQERLKIAASPVPSAAYLTASELAGMRQLRGRLPDIPSIYIASVDEVRGSVLPRFSYINLARTCGPDGNPLKICRSADGAPIGEPVSEEEITAKFSKVSAQCISQKASWITESQICRSEVAKFAGQVIAIDIAISTFSLSDLFFFGMPNWRRTTIRLSAFTLDCETLSGSEWAGDDGYC